MRNIRTYYNIFLTGNCNRRCEYCIVKKNLKGEEDRLTFDSLSHFLNYTRPGDVVEITGGEPTTVPWLEELVKYLNDRHVYIILRTNGYKLFENKYKWLVVVLNTHDEDEEYVKSREALLRETDVIIGKTVPLEPITDANKGGNLQPPYPKWDGARPINPFGNARHINNYGWVWNMMCDAHEGAPANFEIYPTLAPYEEDVNLYLQQSFEPCGTCVHLIAPWTWANRLGLEEEVLREIRISPDKKKVYKALLDDESRKVFEALHRWGCTDREKDPYIHAMLVRELMKASSIISKELDNDIYIAGAGEENMWMSTCVLQHLQNRTKAFIEESHHPLVGKEFRGKPVISIFDYLDIQSDRKRIILGNTYRQDLRFACLYAGVPEEEFLYHFENEQYFDVWSSRDEEFVIDCGVYCIEDAERFIEWGGKGMSYVAIDPIQGKRATKLQTFLERKGYGFINKAAWSEPNKKVEFGHIKGRPDAGRVIKTEWDKTNTTDVVQVDTVTIDELQTADVTLIKIDAVGSEMEVILGAWKTIEIFKPRLAVSVSHNYDDAWKIGALILKICPEYKFRLRHYTTTYHKTILYGEVIE